MDVSGNSGKKPKKTDKVKKTDAAKERTDVATKLPARPSAPARTVTVPVRPASVPVTTMTVTRLPPVAKKTDAAKSATCNL